MIFGDCAFSLLHTSYLPLRALGLLSMGYQVVGTWMAALRGFCFWFNTARFGVLMGFTVVSWLLRWSSGGGYYWIGSMDIQIYFDQNGAECKLLHSTRNSMSAPGRAWIT